MRAQIACTKDVTLIGKTGTYPVRGMGDSIDMNSAIASMSGKKLSLASGKTDANAVLAYGVIVVWA